MAMPLPAPWAPYFSPPHRAAPAEYSHAFTTRHDDELLTRVMDVLKLNFMAPTSLDARPATRLLGSRGSPSAFRNLDSTRDTPPSTAPAPYHHHYHSSHLHQRHPYHPLPPSSASYAFSSPRPSNTSFSHTPSNAHQFGFPHPLTPLGTRLEADVSYPLAEAPTYAPATTPPAWCSIDDYSGSFLGCETPNAAASTAPLTPSMYFAGYPPPPGDTVFYPADEASLSSVPLPAFPVVKSSSLFPTDEDPSRYEARSLQFSPHLDTFPGVSDAVNSWEYNNLPRSAVGATPVPVSIGHRSEANTTESDASAATWWDPVDTLFNPHHREKKASSTVPPAAAPPIVPPGSLPFQQPDPSSSTSHTFSHSTLPSGQATTLYDAPTNVSSEVGPAHYPQLENNTFTANLPCSFPKQIASDLTVPPPPESHPVPPHLSTITTSKQNPASSLPSSATLEGRLADHRSRTPPSTFYNTSTSFETPTETSVMHQLAPHSTHLETQADNGGTSEQTLYASLDSHPATSPWLSETEDEEADDVPNLNLELNTGAIATPDNAYPAPILLGTYLKPLTRTPQKVSEFLCLPLSYDAPLATEDGDAKYQTLAHDITAPPEEVYDDCPPHVLARSADGLQLAHNNDGCPSLFDSHCHALWSSVLRKT